VTRCGAEVAAVAGDARARQLGGPARCAAFRGERWNSLDEVERPIRISARAGYSVRWPIATAWPVTMWRSHWFSSGEHPGAALRVPGLGEHTGQCACARCRS